MSKQRNDRRTATFPFGSYDVFSYLIPGATSILGILNFEYWYCLTVSKEALTPVLSTLLGPAQSIPNDNLVYAISFAALVLCVIYVSGHIVSSVSSLFLDKIYVGKAQGYPYETLLNLPRTSGPGFRRDDAKGFYQGMFFWLNLYLILRFATFFLDFTWLSLALLVSEVVIALASASKLAASLARQFPSSPLYQWLSQPRPRRYLISPIKIYLAKIFPIPFLLISRSLEKHLRTSQAFEDDVRDRYEKVFLREFGINPQRAGSDNFWLCKMFVARKSQEFDKSLTYWLEMYTYARNLATACYISFLYCFCFAYLQYPRHLLTSTEDLFTLTSIPLGYFLMACILAVRFRYIYVGYFNRFLYRCFIFLCSTKKASLNRSQDQ